MLKDVNDPDSLITTTGREDVLNLMAQGVIADGMIPKVEAALKLVEIGIPNVRFVHGGCQNHIALGILPDVELGTRFI